MKCVGYDASFVRRAAKIMEDYVKNPPPPKSKGKKSQMAGEKARRPTGGKNVKTASTRKAKQVRIPST